LLLAIITLILTGCSDGDKGKEHNDLTVYYAKSDTWASTYTLIEDEESIFDSLYIQHIGERQLELKPIEYELEGNGMTTKSTSPQKLQSVRSFQVSGEYNKNIIKTEKSEDIEYTLTITQNGTSEVLVLRQVTE